MMELKARKDVSTDLTWDLSLIYESEDEMYRDVDACKSLCAHMVEAYQGKLHTPEAINASWMITGS